MPRGWMVREEGFSRKLSLVPRWWEGVGRTPPPASSVSMSMVRGRECQLPPPSTLVSEVPGEGSTGSQEVIRGSHVSTYLRENLSYQASCPRWKRQPWTGARLGAGLAGRLGWMGGWPIHPGLLRSAFFSSRLQSPGRALLTHLHPGILHEQLHDVPRWLHL